MHSLCSLYRVCFDYLVLKKKSVADVLESVVELKWVWNEISSLS